MNVKHVIKNAVSYWDLIVKMKMFAYILTNSVGFCEIFSSTLKMEVTDSSKTLVNFYQTTKYHILEDGTYIIHFY
jgi:hypothetical protein